MKAAKQVPEWLINYVKSVKEDPYFNYWQQDYEEEIERLEKEIVEKTERVAELKSLLQERNTLKQEAAEFLKSIGITE